MAMFAGAGISAVGSLIGSGKQARAIKSAAQTQADAAKYAANLQSQAAANSLAFTKNVYGKAAGYEAPWQQAGRVALGQLGAGTANGGQFNSSPTSAQVLGQDPGYQFRLEQGQQALERAEAAGGGVGSGGALKAGVQYGQDYASGEYANAYARFMGTRQANYANLANIAGYGEQANATLTNAGTGASANVSNTAMEGARGAGDYLTQGANASAAGQIGGANVWANNLSNLGNLGQQALAASQSGYQQQQLNRGYQALPIAQGPGLTLPNLDSWNDYSGNTGTANG
jgi:hypothetical protein